MSRGTPTKAASSPSGDVCTGSRIMEQTPTGRATDSELGGRFPGVSEAWRLGLRRRSQSPAAGRVAPPAPSPREQREASSRSILSTRLTWLVPHSRQIACASDGAAGLKGQGQPVDQGRGRVPGDPAVLSLHPFLDFGLWLL